MDELLSTRAIARRLTEEGIPTSRGAVQWQPTAVFRMLTNPVYKGSYRYRQSGQEEILIPVPPLVDKATWEAAQAQLLANSQYSKRNNRHQYLLRGLVRCPRCGGNYTGYTQRGSRGYRCNRSHWGSSSTGQKCAPGAVPAAALEAAVWSAVTNAIQEPQVLVEEYQRLLEASSSGTGLEHEGQQVALAMKRARLQEDRVTQAYVDEAMDLNRYKKEMDRLRTRIRELEGISRELDRKSALEQEAQSGLQYLPTFCHTVAEGLEQLSFDERQELLRLVVGRVTVEDETVRIETVIPNPTEGGQLRTRRGEPFGGLRTGLSNHERAGTPANSGASTIPPSAGLSSAVEARLGHGK